MRIFAGNFAPRGWAFCSGQVLSIAQNPALFSLIGTVYGGDGRTTMGLPDLRGRAPMHPGRGPGLTDRRLGERGGLPAVALTEAQIPSHTHDLRATGPADDDDPGPEVMPARVDGPPLYTADAQALVPAPEGAVAAAGGGQPHANDQPWLGVPFIIALQGLYPARG
ncbi:MAG: phage tail protein [Myxococcales bacterium]|nr:phage tail protein [Myxococcales bacterium]